MSVTRSIRLTTIASKYGLRSGISGRWYATESTSRRQVTVANDDGRVSWSALSTREKVARTTQQTFNFGIVIVGAVMTLGISYFLYDAVFSPESKTSQFSRAFEDIKASADARELLGPSKQMKAYGEPSWNRWTRNRPIASSIVRDAAGKEHMSLRFYVEGPKGKGTVRLQMVRRNQSQAFEYETFVLTVPGHSAVYFHGTDPSKPKSGKMRFLGVNWK